MSTEIVLSDLGQGVLQPAQIKSQVAAIRDLMKSVLVDGTHYGAIPGCGEKPALLQPGGQKLGLMFNLGAQYRINTTDYAGEHREYAVTCELNHRGTGRLIGEGVGTCSTRESKYRYRWEDTGALVPQEYWNARDKALLGGDSFAARKVRAGERQEWHIFHKVDHDNPSDYYNTCLKIAKKRAFLDAILTATAAGDIFMPDDETPQEFTQPDREPEQPKQRVQQPQSRGASTKTEQVHTVSFISEKQAGLLYKRLEAAKVPTEQMTEAFGIRSLDEMPRNRMDEAIQWIQDNAAPF